MTQGFSYWIQNLSVSVWNLDTAYSDLCEMKGCGLG